MSRYLHVFTLLNVSRYKQCYDDSGKLLLVDRGERVRDERVHAFLLIQNELLRMANGSWERKYAALLENTDTKCPMDAEQFNFSSSFLMYPTPNRKISTHRPLATSYTDKSIIIESSICHQLVAEKFEYICIDVLQQKFSRSSYVQRTLLNILPRLAAFNKDYFVENHLPGAMNHLFNIIKGREKNMAFIAIGKLGYPNKRPSTSN